MRVVATGDILYLYLSSTEGFRCKDVHGGKESFSKDDLEMMIRRETFFASTISKNTWGAREAGRGFDV